jgi:hypothetical protein
MAAIWLVTILCQPFGGLARFFFFITESRLCRTAATRPQTTRVRPHHTQAFHSTQLHQGCKAPPPTSSFTTPFRPAFLCTPRAPTGHSSGRRRRRRRRRRRLLLLQASGGSFAVQSTRVLGCNRCGLEVCWCRAVQCCAEKKTVTLHHVLRLTKHSLHLPIHLLPKCQYLKAAIPWSSTKSRESPFLRLPQECRAFACKSSPA